MNYDDLLKENQLLKQEITNLKTQLEKYSNPQKEYYEKNKEIIKEKASKRLTTLDNEKLKQYRRTAYLNQKENRKQKTLENTVSCIFL